MTIKHLHEGKLNRADKTRFLTKVNIYFGMQTLNLIKGDKSKGKIHKTIFIKQNHKG